MNLALLEILECPFCGSGLRLESTPFLEIQNSEVSTGILLCECCAYPIVSGIPYLRTGPAAEAAMELLGKAEKERALLALLGVEEGRSEAVRPLLNGDPTMTFRQALALLDTSAESVYLLYRFSDPTFLANQIVLRAIRQDSSCAAGRVLDLCGGTGHLTRSLVQADPSCEVVLADLSFQKLWLAKQFIAPQCQPVCCNASDPLPFVEGAFALVVCADAYHYIWSKRLLAGEMGRLIGATGVIVLPHLHNALCWSPSQGIPLSPAGYARLFGKRVTRLFKESDLLRAALAGGPIDLAVNFSETELRDEAALVLISSSHEELFRLFRVSTTPKPTRLTLNPLYQFESNKNVQMCKRVFPSTAYEQEYADCKRYLPERVELNATQLAHLENGVWDESLRDLAQRQVLLDLPERYV